MTTTPPVQIDTILVAVDHSPESYRALDLAVAIGAPHHATLALVHVRVEPGIVGPSAEAVAELDNAEHELEQLIATHASQRLASYPARWRLDAAHGTPGQELLRAADEIDADLIVVGHRSHGTIGDILLGSVANHIAHHSHRSVLIAIPPGNR